MSAHCVWNDRLLVIACSSRPHLHPAAVDACCGAVGEVTALVALYPLDTLKVQVQARAATTGAVLTELLALGPAAVVRTLYAGVGSAAVGAAAMGSIYLVAFFGAKRIGQSVATAAAAARRSDGGEGASKSPSALIASAAGATASIVSSVIEAPIEQFKVRIQAGATQGPMLTSMIKTVSAQGLPALYWSFVPFLLKSIPHDVAELFTFSQLNDLRSGSANDLTGWQRSSAEALARMPCSLSDMAIGAAAGATAAVASMPFDVTFTRMNLSAACMVASDAHRPGLAQSLTGFLATARQIMVEGGGPKALFAGLTPRLLQTVPAGIVYWMAVEGARRALHAHCDVNSMDRQQSKDMPATLLSHVSDSSGMVAQESAGVGACALLPA